MSQYKRVLLKLSGEALAGEKKTGFDEETVRRVAAQVKRATDEGAQLGIVIGGGNFWRGRSSKAIDRTKADAIGMLATVMNCLYVSEIFRDCGMQTEIYTPFICASMTKLYSKDDAEADFKAGKVLFFAGGLGHPFFSTDTTAALRASEIKADVILMAKNGVDGVYSDDPKTNPNAERFSELTYMDVLNKGLHVMDSTAISMCMDNHTELSVFNMNEPGNIVKAVQGTAVCTIIR
jgi:uridylate kinase